MKLLPVALIRPPEATKCPWVTAPRRTFCGQVFVSYSYRYVTKGQERFGIKEFLVPLVALVLTVAVAQLAFADCSQVNDGTVATRYYSKGEASL